MPDKLPRQFADANPPKVNPAGTGFGHVPTAMEKALRNQKSGAPSPGSQFLSTGVVTPTPTVEPEDANAKHFGPAEAIPEATT
jgi:hypothetical protein